MNLSVRPSRISGAGNGLFADDAIAAGEIVAEYTGELTTWEKVKTDWQNFYLYVIDDDHVIDAANYPETYARYANDAEGLTAVKGLSNNCEFINIEGRVYIRTTREIQPDEEILVAYGADYWDTVRKNNT